MGEESENSFGADFKYSAHEKELIIGHVFIRLFNQQPTYVLEVSYLLNEHKNEWMKMKLYF